MAYIEQLIADNRAFVMDHAVETFGKSRMSIACMLRAMVLAELITVERQVVEKRVITSITVPRVGSTPWPIVERFNRRCGPVYKKISEEEIEARRDALEREREDRRRRLLAAERASFNRRRVSKPTGFDTATVRALSGGTMSSIGGGL